jgi:UPF0755 protein
MSSQRLILFTIGICFLVGVFLLIGFAYFAMTPADKDGDQKVFYVRPGATLRHVAGELQEMGLITSKSLFLLWARTMGYGKHIKAGEYRLSPAMSPIQILHTLHKGIVVTHPVTIPEGFTVQQISEALVEKGLADKEEFLSLARDPHTARRYGISEAGLEGYLYPDTYHFSKGIAAVDIIDVMVRRLLEVVAPHRERMEQLGMSLEEVITLASIVEKETGRAEERPVIASVFLNRLAQNMRLESDPTVIYGVEEFDGNLTRKDLREATPYNTYVIQGLPPGPIASPGRDAILAVLYPADTQYLYFVSKNDGSHHFSTTLEEHNRAVNVYQRRRPTTSQ